MYCDIMKLQLNSSNMPIKFCNMRASLILAISLISCKASSSSQRHLLIKVIVTPLYTKIKVAAKITVFDHLRAIGQRMSSNATKPIETKNLLSPRGLPWMNCKEIFAVRINCSTNKIGMFFTVFYCRYNWRASFASSSPLIVSVIG